MHFPDSLMSLREADPVRLVRNAIRRILDSVKNPSSRKALGFVLCATLAVGGASGCATARSATPHLTEVQTQEVIKQPETPPQDPVETDEKVIKQPETPPQAPTKSEPDEKPRRKKEKRKKPGDSKRVLV